MNKSPWLGSLALILLGAALGFVGSLGWVEPAGEFPVRTSSPSDRLLLEHIEELVERLVADRQPEITASDRVAEIHRVEVQDDLSASGFAGIREALSRIEEDLTEIKVAMAPADVRLLPESGKYISRKTDLINELHDKIKHDLATLKGVNSNGLSPSAAVYFGWTPQKLYATFGLPDNVHPGIWYYIMRQKNSSYSHVVQFSIRQGMVVGVSIR